MSIAALLQTTSASSIIAASGLAAEFKSIVPGDLFIALGLGWLFIGKKRAAELRK